MWRGNDEEGRQGSSETSSCSTGIPGCGSPGLKISQKVPFFDPSPLNWWSGPESIVKVQIDGENSWALLDSSLTIIAVMPGFIEVCFLDDWPLSDLVKGTLGINGFKGVFSQPLGYINIRVQVEGVWGYDEDQDALVIPDSTGFGSWVPVTLGASPINGIIKVIKESEIDELSVSLNGSMMAKLLACWQAGLSIQWDTVTDQAVDLTYLNEAVKATEK